ncbi:hypothetical protein [Elizabethkingia anophelis]|uniref:Uncharacterized protein n=1 Tax=Elizabethkingia anophelis TaxID=1117645 RepID=A0AAU8VBZ3_9FLAO|nr:hypothetical protein [Elizabethkingia anophelis]AQX00435.1 hypothetical protein BBD32_02625 [Elizabethkingia anophelis]OPB66203.1 hypothetical protein BAY11_14655 [Elizabethkingia anophelis]
MQEKITYGLESISFEDVVKKDSETIFVNPMMQNASFECDMLIPSRISPQAESNESKDNFISKYKKGKCPQGKSRSVSVKLYKQSV